MRFQGNWLSRVLWGKLHLEQRMTGADIPHDNKLEEVCCDQCLLKAAGPTRGPALIKCPCCRRAQSKGPSGQAQQTLQELRYITCWSLHTGPASAIKPCTTVNRRLLECQGRLQQHIVRLTCVDMCDSAQSTGTDPPARVKLRWLELSRQVCVNNTQSGVQEVVTGTSQHL